MIQGDLRHMDRSITITNRDAFNIESTVTKQQFHPTTSLVVGSDGKVVIESRALILNGFIQHQPPWYLQIPPPRIMIQTELQVREQILYALLKTGTYKNALI